MIRLLSGDCRDVLPTLPAESVHCVVTSPPYYGLRDYGTALWDGGDAACDHTPDARCRSTKTTLAQGAEYSAMTFSAYRDTCGKCGAVRVDRQIGLERDPGAYLATMVQVFREVRRVLRRDGTCWVNMGDSYNAGGNGKRLASPIDRDNAERVYGWRGSEIDGGRFVNAPGLAPKQLLLMPARLALALQADGWWVRSDIIWHKPNPMPESCRDRPTSAHEHLFLLTRSARYFYDADAVREAPTWSEAIGTKAAAGRERNVGGRSDGYTRIAEGGGVGCPEGGRNLRNVWTIATHAYPEAHFATFPPELAERCIKAGTSERGCCAACGKPWVRVTLEPYQRTTTGWSPGCQCHGHFEERPAAADWISEETGERKMVRVWVADSDAPKPIPCTVLDPFAGAGTTLLVADRLQRDCVGVDLNVDYTRMAMDRCIADAPLFTSFAPAEPPEDERMSDLFAEAAE